MWSVVVALLVGLLIPTAFFLWREWKRQATKAARKSSSSAVSAVRSDVAASTPSLQRTAASREQSVAAFLEESIEDRAFAFWMAKRRFGLRMSTAATSVKDMRAEWQREPEDVRNKYLMKARIEGEVLRELDRLHRDPNSVQVPDPAQIVAEVVGKDAAAPSRKPSIFSTVGRVVADLMQKQRKNIDELKKRLAGELKPEHDDLFLLRYLLSKGTPDKCVDPIRFCIQWRSDPVNRFHLDLAAAGEDPGIVKVLREHGLCLFSLHKTMTDGGPLVYSRLGLFDGSQVLNLFSVDELVVFLDVFKERAFIDCDRQTRETGILVKMVIVNDMDGMAIHKPPKKWISAFGESTKIAENLYPQVLGANVMVNYPSWVGLLLRIASLFLSKRLMEKFKWCKGDLKHGDVTACSYLKRNIPLDELPSFLGGKCNCPGGCIAGVSNDAPMTYRQVSEKELESLRKAMEEVREVEAEALKRYMAGTPIRECFVGFEGKNAKFIPFGGSPAPKTEVAANAIAPIPVKSSLRDVRSNVNVNDNNNNASTPSDASSASPAKDGEFVLGGASSFANGMEHAVVEAEKHPLGLTKSMHSLLKKPEIRKTEMRSWTQQQVEEHLKKCGATQHMIADFAKQHPDAAAFLSNAEKKTEMHLPDAVKKKHLHWVKRGDYK